MGDFALLGGNVPKDNFATRRRQAHLFADSIDINYAEARRRLADARTGAVDHQHDFRYMAFLARQPYSGGHSVNTDLAARLTAAAQDRCRHCQLMRSLDALEHRPTLAALCGVMLGLVPKAGSVRDSTRRWALLVRRANSDRDASAATAAVWEAIEAMDVPSLYGLLDDALRLHASAGPRPIVIHHSDFGDGSDGVPHYQVTLGTRENGGRRVPVLALGHEAGRAGLAHLRKVGLPDWDGGSAPVADPQWQVRVNLGARALEAIVRVDAQGLDDIVLWKAAKLLQLSAGWWDLLDHAQHIVVWGPSAVGAPESPQRVAVLAHVTFR
ncbi:hypothetical protein [Streptomyces xanthophaeus]